MYIPQHRFSFPRPTVLENCLLLNTKFKGLYVSNRRITTQKLTPEESDQILISQRRNRPTSPHLTIYKPQIPWILSSLNRITGVVLSGGLYIFGSAYLIAPLLGWHLESASIAAAFATWPVAAKVATKFAVAWPFTFHGFNGLRHLVWDIGKSFTNKVVIRTGWTVVGLSAASALALATMF
jgi:succinate dehydrogenase (ubiquinone) cytochrome b560 subunit